MNIGSVSGSSPSTAFQVKLTKGQDDQQAKVVSTILSSATQTASISGKGQKLNVLA